MNFNLQVVVAKQRLHNLRSKWCVHLMSTTFPYYIWIQTGLYSVVALESLEWDIHGLFIPAISFDLRCESITLCVIILTNPQCNYVVHIRRLMCIWLYIIALNVQVKLTFVTYIVIQLCSAITETVIGQIAFQLKSVVKLPLLNRQLLHLVFILNAYG